MFRSILVGSATAAVLCASLAAPAFAATASPTASPTPSSPSPTSPAAPTPAAGATHAARNHTLADVQARGKKATDARLAKLTAAATRVQDDTSLTASDKATLSARLTADATAMKALAATISSDTTRPKAVSDVKSVFTDYRVYAVTLAQARVVAKVDRLDTRIVPRLTTREARLTARLSGRDKAAATPALQSDLSDLATQITAITGDTKGVAESALAVTPAAFNANKSVLDSERSAVTSASAAAKKAHSDLAAIASALRTK